MIRIIHVIEAISVILGLFILTATFVNLSVAEAAGLPSLLVRDSHVLLGGAGMVLTTLPLTRRLTQQVFFSNGHVSEFKEMTNAMRRIGLQNRVQATNLYLAGMPDESWNKVFPSDRELWRWLGEAYEDGALRRQMHPDVAMRAERAARTADLQLHAALSPSI